MIFRLKATNWSQKGHSLLLKNVSGKGLTKLVSSTAKLQGQKMIEHQIPAAVSKPPPTERGQEYI